MDEVFRAEKLLIGLMLLYPSDVKDASELITSQDFSEHECRKIYISMLNIMEDNKFIDLISVNSYSGISFESLSFYLSDNIPPRNYLKQTIDAIKRNTKIIKYRSISTKIIDGIKDGVQPEDIEKHYLSKFAELNVATSSDFTIETPSGVPPTTTKWIIKNVLSEDSCTLLVSEEKSGKTWILFHMAICIANGIKFFDTFDICQTGPVLVYSPESSIEKHKKRIWQLSLGMGIDPRESSKNIHFIDQKEHLAIDDQKSIHKLKKAILKIKPKILILDPLISILGNADENASGEMQSALTNLKQVITPENSIVIIIAHHMNKGNKSLSPFHGMRGSTAIGAWSDSRISLKKVSISKKEADALGIDPVPETSAKAKRRVDLEHRDDTVSSGWDFEIVDDEISTDNKKFFNLPNEFHSVTLQKVAHNKVAQNNTKTSLQKTSLEKQKTKAELSFEIAIESVKRFLHQPATQLDASTRTLHDAYSKMDYACLMAREKFSKITKLPGVCPIVVPDDMDTIEKVVDFKKSTSNFKQENFENV